jgi:DNA repair exonuclease SbcCD ATPase subunit
MQSLLAGDGRTAARLYHEAFRLDPVPGYLYGAARAEQAAGLLEEAARDYRQTIAQAGADDALRLKAEHYLAEVLAAREARGQEQLLAEQRQAAEAERAAVAERERQAAAEAARLEAAAREQAANEARDRLAAAERARVAAETEAKRLAAERDRLREEERQALAVAEAARRASAWKRPAGWTILGLGVAAGIASVWLGLDALADQRDLDLALGQRDAHGKVEGVTLAQATGEQEWINDRIVTTWVLAGAAAVGLGAGLGLVLDAPPDRPPRAALVGGPGVLALRVAF